MKKTALIFCFITFWIFQISAQDIIISKKGDTINCKITKIKKDYVFFTFMYNTEVRNTFMALNEIKLYKYDYFKIKEVPTDKVTIIDNYTKLRVAIHGGYSYLLAKVSSNTPAELMEYTKKLKSGSHIDGNINYFINDKTGFGMRYSIFNTKNSKSNVTLTDYMGYPTATGTLKDEIRIEFFGINYCNRLYSADKNRVLITNISIGSLNYRNQSSFIYPINIVGNTVGLLYDIGGDFKLDNDFFLGIRMSFLLGTISRIEVNGGGVYGSIELDDNEKLGLSRIDLSAGLRWTF